MCALMHALLSCVCAFVLRVCSAGVRVCVCHMSVLLFVFLCSVLFVCFNSGLISCVPCVFLCFCVCVCYGVFVLGLSMGLVCLEAAPMSLQCRRTVCVVWLLVCLFVFGVMCNCIALNGCIVCLCCTAGQ